MKKNIIILIILVIIAGGIYFWQNKNNQNQELGKNTAELKQEKKDSEKELEKFGTGKKITFYQSPTCGCCGKYASRLRQRGFEVEIIKTTDMANIKAKYNLPAQYQSCHTMVMDNYFMEGHLPMEAVAKLVKEKPDIAGIILPGMPAGSPGMGGSKKGIWEIFQKNLNGEFATFLKI